MDDGSITNSGIILTTKSLKSKELKLLQEVLKSKYKLETTIKNK
jgi:F0F1-type ATP synthase delta subunit